MFKWICLKATLALPFVISLPVHGADEHLYLQLSRNQSDCSFTQEPIKLNPENTLFQDLDLAQQTANESQGDQASNQSTPANSADSLFERVFGKPRSLQSRPIVVPLLIDRQLKKSQLLVLVNPDGQQIRVQAAPLLDQLADLIRPDLLTQLQSAIAADGNLTIAALQSNELDATFDDRKLELSIQIPATARRTNISQIGNVPPEVANALSPSRVSGYLNLFGGQDFVWSGATTGGRQPLRLNLEGALNIKGWVLEGGIDFTEGQDSAWIRRDLRLVRDDPARTLRYVAGDLVIPTRGYQASLPMFGVTIARNFSLQPYRLTRPVNRFEFFLERPARVEVLINDRLTRTLRLPAGRQDIRDLPLNAGINDVQLIVTDDVGRVRRLSFPAAVAADLLAPGVHQFAYSLGFPWYSENGIRTYDWTQPTLTAFHRWGMLNTLTFGGYLQANVNRQVAGFEGIWATGFGNWAWNIAASHDGAVGTDIAARVQYELIRTGTPSSSQRALRFALEYRGANFRQLERSLIAGLDETVSLDLAASYRQTLASGMSMTLGGRYQIGRSGSPNAYGIDLGVSKSFNQGLNLNLNLSYQRDRNGQSEQRAYVSLLWLLPSSGQSLAATTHLSNQRGASREMTWSFDPPDSMNSWSGALTLSTNSSYQKATGRLNYTGYRTDIGFSHDGWSEDGSSSISQVSRLTFGTALVFAGGQFGWSRPIDNSFALIVRQGTLREQTIGVNPTGRGYMARADGLGAAVVPALKPYYLSNVSIDAPNLPLGFEVGRRSYSLLPTYRSGTLIRVGTEATVFLRGTLVNAQAEPLALQSGQVISLSDPNWQPMTIFTNQIGRFALSGFKPGKYEIRFVSPSSSVQFVIPQDQSGIYDVGTLRLFRLTPNIEAGKNLTKSSAL